MASGVAVHKNGSFTARHVSLANPSYTACRLRAIPSGTTPTNLKPFTGPRLLIGFNRTYTQASGPNAGTLYDFYSFYSQLAGGFDFESLSSCGVCDGYLSPPNFSLGTITFWSNAALFELTSGPLIRSELQIDSANAYATYSADNINSAATGLPKLKYSYSQNAKTGDVVIRETEPLVKCNTPTYPPTTLSCTSFVSTGVTAMVTMAQDHSGRVAWSSVVFKSTDGKPHVLDLLWDNNQRFYRGSGNATNLEYRFPGHSSYATHVLSDLVQLPKGQGTIFVRMHGASDGDTSTGQGAIVYDRTAVAAYFRQVDTDRETFTLDQTGKIPAYGSTRYRFAYVQGYKAADVAALAKQATTVFKGCTVPSVVGKSLAAAKKAIKKAHCAVGKIRYVHPTKASAGRVVSESPKAKTKVDYGTKVSLKVGGG